MNRLAIEHCPANHPASGHRQFGARQRCRPIRSDLPQDVTLTALLASHSRAAFSPTALSTG
jgi:hypothetical protein